MRLVKLVLSKDSVKDAIPIVGVEDPLNEVLDGGDDRHVRRKEKCSIWQHRAKTAHDEEEKLYDRQQDCAIDEFIEDYSKSSVKNRTVLEK